MSDMVEESSNRKPGYYWVIRQDQYFKGIANWGGASWSVFGSLITLSDDKFSFIDSEPVVPELKAERDALRESEAKLREALADLYAHGPDIDDMPKETDFDNSFMKAMLKSKAALSKPDA